MSTPPCTALVKTKNRLPVPPGTLCGKDKGTIPTPDGPRCYSHLKREQRLQDPGSRPPVRNPKSVEDVIRLSGWAMSRLAGGNLSAPHANAIGGMSRVMLRALDRLAQTQAELDFVDANAALLVAIKQDGEISASLQRSEKARTAFSRAVEAWGRLRRIIAHPSTPVANTEPEPDDAGEEHRTAIAKLDPDNAPLDDDVAEILDDATPEAETEDR
jgi:hypothetical protein